MADAAEAVCLIKPQFEAGRGKVGKKGVVREPEIHIEVLQRICAFIQNNGFGIAGLTFSPVKGPEGNIEYLAYIKKDAEAMSSESLCIEKLVAESHNQLNGGEH
jgi:23S rRNA (cytidine1920-2'-O)/16S rRNA (cytidine1409-2'-O)-methyltransferase